MSVCLSCPSAGLKLQHGSTSRRLNRPVFACAGMKAMGSEERPRQDIMLGLAAVAAALSLSSTPALAARLPPIDSDPNRCERAFVGNTIGQANAVSDKVLDLRQCKLSGANLSTVVLAGALLSDADLSNANLREAVLTKAYVVNANLSGSDMTNAVVDRVDFSKSNLSNVKFINAVVTGTVFEGANLTGTEWEDSLIGSEDVKRLCLNPTLKGESRMGVGCRQ